MDNVEKLQQENSIKLDGKEITKEDFEKEKQRADQRIVEDGSANSYKTLKRLRD